MSLKRNIIASYISQIYVSIIGIVIVPLYLKYMGPEAFGLVGFFSMLQAWFNILDMGLTPTIARETARFRGGKTDALSFRRLVRALEGIFLVVALVGGGTLFAASAYIVHYWLKVGNLQIEEAQMAIQLMAIIIALRWMSGLYRGAVSGSEQLVWLGTYNVVIATLRFVGVLGVLKTISPTPIVFFYYQLGVAFFELLILAIKAYSLLPNIPNGKRIPWSWSPLKPVLKFSLTIAFTSSVFVLVTQTDKLVLSKILSLEDYGYFTLAVLLASGVSIISSPISAAILPRMTKMEAEGDKAGVIRLYRQATQMVAIIAGVAAITVALCAEPLLLAWTGNGFLAHNAAPILMLYALGNGVLGVAAFPYYLQYAKGELKLHLIGNVLFVVILIPTIIWAATQYGAIGAGYAWLAINVVFFIVWIPIVHHRFLNGLHLQWVFRDIGMIVGLPMVCAFRAYQVIHWPKIPLLMMVGIAMAGGSLLVLALFGSSWVREMISHKLGFYKIKDNVRAG